MENIIRTVLFLVVACCATADVINVKDCGKQNFKFFSLHFSGFFLHVYCFQLPFSKVCFTVDKSVAQLHRYGFLIESHSHSRKGQNCDMTKQIPTKKYISLRSKVQKSANRFQKRDDEVGRGQGTSFCTQFLYFFFPYYEFYIEVSNFWLLRYRA